MTRVAVNWHGDRRDTGAPITAFTVRSGSGHQAELDEHAPFGDDQGMRPTEMLLGALGGCTGVNAVLLLQKYRQPFTALTVEVEGDAAAEWPKAFTAIRVTFAITWSGEFDEALVARALDDACNRYCPVDATLTHGTAIQVQRRDLRQPAP